MSRSWGTWAPHLGRVSFPDPNVAREPAASQSRHAADCSLCFPDTPGCTCVRLQPVFWFLVFPTSTTPPSRALQRFFSLRVTSGSLAIRGPHMNCRRSKRGAVVSEYQFCSLCSLRMPQLTGVFANTPATVLLRPLHGLFSAKFSSSTRPCTCVAI